MTYTIRPTSPADLIPLAAIADATGLFPGAMLEPMATPIITAAPSDDLPGLWFTAIDQDDRPAGFCYAVPETLAEGVWNMLALAVDPAHQGQGAGGALTTALEARLRIHGQRLVIADTSGTDAFTRTRQFYETQGYRAEAVIADFWAPGDAKVTYTKTL